MTAPDASNTPRHEHSFVPGVFSAAANRPFKRAINGWKQGDILTGVGLFWVTPDGLDPLTDVTGSHTPDDPLPVFTWDGESADASKAVGAPDWPAAMSIVTSQTCDIAAAGPGERHHTVQVAPLERYEHRDPSVRRSIERGEYVDLTAIPATPGPGKWAANLRISLPVSKAILAAQTPIHGFTDEASALAFAERVAAKIRRPALHDALSETMTNSLRELVDNARNAGAGWPEEIEQFRLEILEGTRLEPVKVRIMAVTLGKLAADDRQDLNRWRGKQNKSLKNKHDISLALMRYAQLKDLSVVEYRIAVQLRVPELGQSLMYY